MSIFNILTGQKPDMTELKLVWTVSMTGLSSKIILSPVSFLSHFKNNHNHHCAKPPFHLAKIKNIYFLFNH